MTSEPNIHLHPQLLTAMFHCFYGDGPRYNEMLEAKPEPVSGGSDDSIGVELEAGEITPGPILGHELPSDYNLIGDWGKPKPVETEDEPSGEDE